MMGKKNIDFEELLLELEAKTLKLEEGSMNLDESMKTYEEAMELLLSCRKLLEKAETKIQLLKEKNGEWITEEIESELP